MKLNDALSGLLLALLAVAILFNVSGFPNIPGQNIGPGAFPGLLAVLLLVCAALLIIKGLRERSKSGQSWFEWGDWIRSKQHFRNFLITVGCLFFYIRPWIDIFIIR